MAQAENTNVTISIKEGEKNGRPWKGVLVEIGEWSQLIFPRTNFEMKHIEKILNGENS